MCAQRKDDFACPTDVKIMYELVKMSIQFARSLVTKNLNYGIMFGFNFILYIHLYLHSLYLIEVYYGLVTFCNNYTP